MVSKSGKAHIYLPCVYTLYLFVRLGVKPLGQVYYVPVSSLDLEFPEAVMELPAPSFGHQWPAQCSINVRVNNKQSLPL